MFPAKFIDLESMGTYLLSKLEFHPQKGFTFSKIHLGMSFAEVSALLGASGRLNTESDQQQTLRFQAPIDHPKEGIRNHHQLDVLFWAFNRTPFNTIKIHFNYFQRGSYATPFKEFVQEFISILVEKFDFSYEKSLRNGKEEVKFKVGKHKLHFWRNAEGVRITIK